MNAILRKTKNAQPMGEYKPTEIDSAKKSAYFRLVSAGGKNKIIWQDGRAESVTDAKLEMLQNSYTWATDF